MEQVALIVFISIVGVCGAVGTAIVTWHFRFIDTLRYDYPDIWKDMGEPVVMSINPVRQLSSIVATVKYLLSKDYLKLQDKKFTNVCLKMRRLYPILFCLSVLVVISFVVWTKVMEGGFLSH